MVSYLSSLAHGDWPRSTLTVAFTVISFEASYAAFPWCANGGTAIASR